MNGYIMFPDYECVHTSKLIGPIRPPKITKKKKPKKVAEVVVKTEEKVEVAV